MVLAYKRSEELKYSLKEHDRLVKLGEEEKEILAKKKVRYREEVEKLKEDLEQLQKINKSKVQKHLDNMDCKELRELEEKLILEKRAVNDLKIKCERMYQSLEEHKIEKVHKDYL